MTAKEMLLAAGYSDTPEGRAAFYKRYPSEESFMQDKEMQMRMGGNMPCMNCGGTKYQFGGKKTPFQKYVAQYPTAANDTLSKPDIRYDVNGVYTLPATNTPYEVWSNMSDEAFDKLMQQQMLEEAYNKTYGQPNVPPTNTSFMPDSMLYELRDKRYKAKGGILDDRSFGNAMRHYADTHVPNFVNVVFANGGGIHLDPAKRGTFKAQATRMGMSMDEAASKILNAREGEYTPAMRRKANFYKNFAKAYGGSMNSYQEGGMSQEDYEMQIIEQFVAINGGDVNQILQSLNQMSQEERQKTIQQMEAVVQQSVQSQGEEMAEGPMSNPQEEAMEQPMQARYGGMYGYKQEGGTQDQILQYVAQSLQQGKDPQTILSELVKAGIPEEQAKQAIQSVMQSAQQPESEIVARTGGQFGGKVMEDMEEDQEEEDADMNEDEMAQMRYGGIPERYRKMGFNKVGAKRQSTRPGKKWMVLAKKGDKYKIIHGGYKGMQDFKQHNNSQRRENFWNRMGGKDSAKANDPFSPLYWHKRFGTWANGGSIPQYAPGGGYNDPNMTQAFTIDENGNQIPTVPNVQYDSFANYGQANPVGPVSGVPPSTTTSGQPMNMTNTQSSTSSVGLGQKKSGMNMNAFGTPKLQSNLPQIQSNSTKKFNNQFINFSSNASQNTNTQPPVNNQSSSQSNTTNSNQSSVSDLPNDLNFNFMQSPDNSTNSQSFGKYDPNMTQAFVTDDSGNQVPTNTEVGAGIQSQQTTAKEWNLTGNNTATTAAAAVNPDNKKDKDKEAMNKMSNFFTNAASTGRTALPILSDLTHLYARNRERFYDRRDMRENMQRMGATDNSYYETPGYLNRGWYTNNAGVGPNFDLRRVGAGQTALYGKFGGQYAYGGQYEEGGTYYLTDGEIQHILANGGQIEYI